MSGLLAALMSGEHPAARVKSVPSPPRRGNRTHRFEIKLDPSQVQVISFEKLLADAEVKNDGPSELANGDSKDSFDSDQGSCYDSDDSFLDDTELVKELQPSELKLVVPSQLKESDPAFFINTGKLEAEPDLQLKALTKRLEENAAPGNKPGQKRKRGNKGKSNHTQKASAVTAGGTGSVNGQNLGQRIRDSSGQKGSLGLTSPTGQSGNAAAGATAGGGEAATNKAAVSKSSPRGPAAKKAGAMKKKPALPKLLDSIMTKVEELEQFLATDETIAGISSQLDASVSRGSLLPPELDPPLKAIERIVRLHVSNKADWKEHRDKALKHVTSILATRGWKVTAAKLSKMGDEELASSKVSGRGRCCILHCCLLSFIGIAYIKIVG
jgi:hypothetical protein